jgi:rRNA maturation endonuclease Nob1
MEICINCGMHMKPFPDDSCEFCGEKFNLKTSHEKET